MAAVPAWLCNDVVVTPILVVSPNSRVQLGIPSGLWPCESAGMRIGIVIDLTSADRERLERICKDHDAPQKRVWRAEIVLHSADWVGTREIMRRTDTSKTCVWRWQERFMQERVKGLLRDKTRPTRIPALTPEVVAWVASLTHEEPPGETTRWTASLMAREAGISVSSVHRIWRAHDLQPHRVRHFKLSNDPEFIDKLLDAVGLYVAPPAHPAAAA